MMYGNGGSMRRAALAVALLAIAATTVRAQAPQCAPPGGVCRLKSSVGSAAMPLCCEDGSKCAEDKKGSGIGFCPGGSVTTTTTAPKPTVTTTTKPKVTTTTKPGATTTTTTLPSPVIMDGQRASIRWEDDLAVNPLTGNAADPFTGETTNEPYRNALMRARVSYFASWGPILRDQFPSLSTEYRKLKAVLSEILRRFMSDETAYQAGSWQNKQETHSVAAIQGDATHFYSSDRNTMNLIRRALVDPRKGMNALCGDYFASRPQLKPLLDYADMRVDNGVCVLGAIFPPTFDARVIDKRRLYAGMMDGARIFQPLTILQDIRLTATAITHHRASADICAGQVPTPGATAASHTDYERSMAVSVDGKEDPTNRLHFGQIMFFPTGNDPQWGPLTCAWKGFENLTHSGPNPTRLFKGEDVSWARNQRTHVDAKTGQIKPGGLHGAAEAAAFLHLVSHVGAAFDGDYLIDFPTVASRGAPSFDEKALVTMTPRQFIEQPGLAEELVAVGHAGHGLE